MKDHSLLHWQHPFLFLSIWSKMHGNKGNEEKKSMYGLFHHLMHVMKVRLWQAYTGYTTNKNSNTKNLYPTKYKSSHVHTPKSTILLWATFFISISYLLIFHIFSKPIEVILLAFLFYLLISLILFINPFLKQKFMQWHAYENKQFTLILDLNPDTKTLAPPSGIIFMMLWKRLIIS